MFVIKPADFVREPRSAEKCQRQPLFVEAQPAAALNTEESQGKVQAVAFGAGHFAGDKPFDLLL